MISEPAKANELTSTWNNPSNATPKKRKVIMRMPALKVAVGAWIFTPRFFRSRMMGSEPMISITENRIMVTDKTAVIAMAFKLLYTNINGI